MNVQQPSPIANPAQSQPSCQVIQQQHQQQEMHNMGYPSMTPHHSSMSGYGHVHSNQSCPPGSVETMDPSSQVNLESPHSIQSVSSVDTNHPHGPASVENYHQQQQMHQQQTQQQMYESCKYGTAHSPMVMNPPTPQPAVHHGKPATPQQSELSILISKLQLNVQFFGVQHS